MRKKALVLHMIGNPLLAIESLNVARMMARWRDIENDNVTNARYVSFFGYLEEKTAH
jgi:hypothetical protein